jgi:ABC-type bacteriocin/lantibiotic exporter with double-glycine peptidase domain
MKLRIAKMLNHFKSKPERLNSKMSALDMCIAFISIGVIAYFYIRDEKTILNSVSFKIPGGSKVGIVGTSGAG